MYGEGALLQTVQRVVGRVKDVVVDHSLFDEPRIPLLHNVHFFDLDIQRRNNELSVFTLQDYLEIILGNRRKRLLVECNASA